MTFGDSPAGSTGSLGSPGPAPNLDPSTLAFPVDTLTELSLFASLMEYAPIKALLPIPLLLVIAPAIWWFFRDTWQKLDAESALLRQQSDLASQIDYRPAVCLLLTAVTLTLHEYYGGRPFYDETIRPVLRDWEAGGRTWLKLGVYDEYYSYAWWVFARVAGYVLVPLAAWKLLFPKDSLLDMGLRVRGTLSHLWIYGVSLLVVIGAMAVLAPQRDFLTYYPFYRNSSRSWWDFLAWESIYFVQFFALEFFFRGWMLAALRRSMGASAIFVMAVPYCMIHYGKPYLEAHAAIVAGVVLGSLAMRTRSIYAGFLVHITVAFLMDFLALFTRDALPTTFWPPGP